jgi:hypothetical protein
MVTSGSIHHSYSPRIKTVITKLTETYQAISALQHADITSLRGHLHNWFLRARYMAISLSEHFMKTSKLYNQVKTNIRPCRIWNADSLTEKLGYTSSMNQT